MRIPIPESWKFDPPHTLVAGDGPHAAVLAQILDAEMMDWESLSAGPQAEEATRYSRVLNDLSRVFIVGGATRSTADFLECHEAIWNWIAKLAPGGTQHDVAMIFVLPESASRDCGEALAIGLGIPVGELVKSGHGVVRMTEGLGAMLETSTRVVARDRVRYLARKKSDNRHAALANLRETLSNSEPDAGIEAARQILEAFADHEHHLDLFCTSPNHRNGNRIRTVLHHLVTKPVTPMEWEAFQHEIPALLRSLETAHAL